MKKYLISLMTLIFLSVSTVYAYDSDLQILVSGKNYMYTAENVDFTADDSFCLGLKNYNFFTEHLGFAEQIYFAEGIDITAGLAMRVFPTEKIAFQFLAGLHYMNIDSYSWDDSDDYDISYRMSENFIALGVGLDAQLKLTASRKCSPIFGIDFSADPLTIGKMIKNDRRGIADSEPSKKEKNNVYCVFTVTPYIAFCLNF